MKTTLIFCLICFAFSNLGPADNEKHSSYSSACGSEEEAKSVSDCVDLNLYFNSRYYNRCCFVRVIFMGKYHQDANL